MTMTRDAESEISQAAITWVRSHSKEIVERFASDYLSAKGTFVSVFMAGSPGAGKTEFSTRLLNSLEQKQLRMVRIDPDEVRSFMPLYVPGKAELFQGAVGLAIEKIHDYVLDKDKHFLLDGTSSKLEKLRSNIQRSLDKERDVHVEYVYQDPFVAWDFTQKRERLEGRNIPKDAFIDQFFSAYANVEQIKKEFSRRITIDLIQRNIKTNEYTILFNVNTIVEHLVLPYTKYELLQRL